MAESQSAGGVVVNEQNKVLVASQHGTSWSLPKGHIEEGENALKAAVREIGEETGITELEFIKDLGSYQRHPIAQDISQEDKTVLKTIFMFLFKTKQTELKPTDNNNPEARWVEKEKVADLLTHYKDKEFFLSVVDKI